MTIMVTGGTGFLGSFVVKELADKGETPVVFDIGDPTRSLQDVLGSFRFVKGGLNDFDLLVRTMEENKVNRVVHLAAFLQFGCERDPRKAIEVNVQGTLNIAEACHRTGVKKIVFASSGAVYGPLTESMDEDHPILPGISLYGATKFLGEVFLDRWQRAYEIPFIALRYWGIYGPGEVHSPGMAEVFKKIEKTILGEDVVIEEVGADERRHFCFVKDAAQATTRALDAEKNRHKVFNIAGGDDSYVTFSEFHRVIKDLNPSAGEIIFKGKGQDRGKVDISRAREELGYTPKYTLEEGIKEDISSFLAWQKS